MEREKISTKKKLLAVVGIGLIVLIAVGIAVSQMSTTPESEATHEETPSAEEHADMDYNLMFSSQVDKLVNELEADPSNLETRISLADTYYLWAEQIANGNVDSEIEIDELYARAIEQYELAEELDPEDPKIKSYIGYVYYDWAHLAYDQGKDAEYYEELYGRSIGYFDKALAIDTGSILSTQEVTNIIVNKSIIFFALGQDDEAISLLEERRAVDGTHVQLLLNLGNFYESKGDKDSARTCYEEAQKAAEAAGNSDLAALAEERKNKLA